MDVGVHCLNMTASGVVAQSKTTFGPPITIALSASALLHPYSINVIATATGDIVGVKTNFGY